MVDELRFRAAHDNSLGRLACRASPTRSIGASQLAAASGAKAVRSLSSVETVDAEEYGPRLTSEAMMQAISLWFRRIESSDARTFSR